MEFKIVKATVEEKETLQNLMQYYFYDFSEFLHFDVEESGRYGDYPYLDAYFTEVDQRFPYIVKVENKLAGFVLVRTIEEDEKTYHSIAEFFIFKRYRRSGLGKEVAHQIFQMHPGQWEVFQIEQNKPAQNFWNKVIDEYTQGNFVQLEKENKVYQEFVSPAIKAPI